MLFRVKIGFSVVFCVLLVSCFGGNRGELVGVRDVANWSPDRPYGMSLVNSGVFSMGSADNSFLSDLVAPAKTVSISAFFIDETEISNNEYRQFVNWVRDSVIRYRLASKVVELGLDNSGIALASEEEEFEEEEEDSGGIADYKFSPIDTVGNPYNKYLIDNYGDNERLNFKKKLNWDIDLVWDFNQYPDGYYAEVMDSMYLPLEETFQMGRIIDIKKLKYKYYERVIGNSKRYGDKSGNLEQHEIMVYPDTLVWLRDFTYSYNEPMHQDYFWHVAYDNYPVVGVTWDQANAFCDWRTRYMNGYRKSNDDYLVSKFRLPTEAEWEYAARGGLENVPYPWGGPYVRDNKGCFLANFKPLRGDYIADGSLYTARVDEYPPNDYDLYNMAGNVSEWTATTYNHSLYTFSLTFNPQYRGAEGNFNKVIRGGSWKDVSHFLQVGVREYEHKDSCTSYIGFRTVQTYLGVVE